MRIAVCLIFAMTSASGMETWENGNDALILANEPASSLPEVQHDH